MSGQDADRPGRDEDAHLLRRYWWTYAAGCAGIVALSVSGIASGTGAGLVLAALGSGSLGVAGVLRALELRAYRHIPGPEPSFFLGNLGDLLARGHGARDGALADLHARHGPVVRLHLAWGSRPYVSLSTPSRTLYRKDLDSFRRADRTLLPASLMGMEMGEEHRGHRRQLEPLFTRRAVQRRLPVIHDVTAAYLGAWKGGRTVHGDLLADIHRWSAHCLGSVLFGAAWDRDADLAAYLDAIATIEEEISFRTFHPFFAPWASLRRRARARAAYRTLSDFLARVRERHEPGEADTVLDRLVSLEAAGRWTRAACVEEMMSLVLGGTDAMSYLASQSLVLLSRAPEVQRRIRADLGRAGDSEAHAVLHETMRLFPPVPFSARISGRHAVTEQGFPIPARTRLMWTKTVVGRNGSLFSDPDRFLPERFSSGSASGAPQVSARTAAPFGAGPRHCIGHRLAETQCAVLLAAILRDFHLEPIRDAEVRFRATVSIQPSTVPVRLVPIG